jgi:hypothetical protein
MFGNLERADPIIFIAGMDEKRLPDTELLENQKPVVMRVGRAARQPLPIPKHILMSPMETLNNFWQVVAKIEWQNCSDGIITKQHIEDFRSNLSEHECDYFRLVFPHYFEIATENATVRTVENGDIVHIATHIVMMGQEMFEQYISDNTWVEFLIKNNDYQKLYNEILEVFEIPRII